jgi:hypothetical protein
MFDKEGRLYFLHDKDGDEKYQIGMMNDVNVFYFFYKKKG